MSEGLKKYIAEIFGIEASIQPWQEQNKLPFFLLETFSFLKMTILNQTYLLLFLKENIELTPNQIKKTCEQVRQKSDLPYIYVANVISSYARRRLIEQRIPFIIPKNQIFIPDLGIYLSEHFKQQQIHKSLFSPATQVVLIWTLLKEKIEKMTPSELAAALSYSIMTMTRAFNELETEGIGKFIHVGRERYWVFEESKKDLWEQTKDMLRSPIKAREYMKVWPGMKMPHLPLSGISALSEKTMINSPRLPSYAIGSEEFKKNKPKGFYHSHSDEADFELEIWHYDPSLFSVEGKIDPFSLFLSLRESSDERIEAAIEELMEQNKW